MWAATPTRPVHRTIRSAVERGITLIDTAPVYGFGHSEELSAWRSPGGFATGGHRDQGRARKWRDGKVRRNSTPARIRKEVEGSLRRLRTTTSILPVHWPDPLVPIQETAGTLGRLLWKARSVRSAVSNFSAAQMAQFREAAPIHSVQPPYNLLSGTRSARSFRTRGAMT